MKTSRRNFLKIAAAGAANLVIFNRVSNAEGQIVTNVTTKLPPAENRPPERPKDKIGEIIWYRNALGFEGLPDPILFALANEKALIGWAHPEETRNTDFRLPTQLIPQAEMSLKLVHQIYGPLASNNFVQSLNRLEDRIPNTCIMDRCMLASYDSEENSLNLSDNLSEYHIEDTLPVLLHEVLGHTVDTDNDPFQMPLETTLEIEVLKWKILHQIFTQIERHTFEHLFPKEENSYYSGLDTASLAHLSLIGTEEMDLIPKGYIVGLEGLFDGVARNQSEGTLTRGTLETLGQYLQEIELDSPILGETNLGFMIQTKKQVERQLSELFANAISAVILPDDYPVLENPLLVEAGLEKLYKAVRENEEIISSVLEIVRTISEKDPNLSELRAFCRKVLEDNNVAIRETYAETTMIDAFTHASDSDLMKFSVSESNPVNNLPEDQKISYTGSLTYLKEIVSIIGYEGIDQGEDFEQYTGKQTGLHFSEFYHLRWGEVRYAIDVLRDIHTELVKRLYSEEIPMQLDRRDAILLDLIHERLHDICLFLSQRKYIADRHMEAFPYIKLEPNRTQLELLLRQTRTA